MYNAGWHKVKPLVKVTLFRLLVPRNFTKAFPNLLIDFCRTGYTQVELTNPCLEISPPSLTKTS